MSRMRFALSVLALAAVLSTAAFAATPGNPDNGRAAIVKVNPGLIEFLPVDGYDGRTLTVSGCDLVMHRAFDPKENPTFEPFDDYGERLMDGEYTYELVLQPRVDGEIREILERARAEGDERTIWELRRDGKLPQAAIQTGYFHVVEGTFLFDEESQEPGNEEKRDSQDPTEVSARPQAGLLADDTPPNRGLALDQVIANDLIVIGSQCVGFDCVNGESWDADTIRLKENNLRIHFDDTSTAASYPRTDWRLIANDRTNGGASKFAIQDASANREVFAVEANAPTNALYVDDGGRVGLGTSTPSVEMHITNGDSPTLRLDQTASSGFAPQVWDVAGNETNFFIRDASNGSTLPFRIRPGASSNVLFIDTDDDTAMGHTSPDAQLHLKRTNGSAKLQVEEASSTTAGRTVFELVNNGNVQFMLRDTDTGHQWQFSALTASDLFQISKLGTDQGKFRVRGAGGLVALVGNDNIFDLSAAGDLTIDGTLTQNSDRTKKENFGPLDRQEVLEKVLALPITTWNYKDNDPSVRHLGPMAQDFHAAFGLGGTDTGISSLDATGVALVAIQATAERQQAELEAKDRQIADLEERLARLEALLAGDRE